MIQITQNQVRRMEKNLYTTSAFLYNRHNPHTIAGLRTEI